MYYGRVYSITGGGSKKDDAEKKEDVLNIFSVASGHLYERFLRWVSFILQTHSHAYDRPYAWAATRIFFFLSSINLPILF